MFSRWGAFVYRHRRIVLVFAIVVGVAAGSVAGRAASVLSAGGWLDPDSESAAVADRLAAEFGAGRGALIALYQGPDGADARDPQFQAAIAASLQDLADDPDVAGIIGYAETGDARFISPDGSAAYVVVDLEVSDEASVPLLDRFEAQLREPGDGIKLLLGGYAPLTRDSAHQSEQDLVKAETVSLPIAALVLVLVFTSILAAGIPLLVAGLAIPATLALVYVVGQQVELSIYVQNVSTMLGLALAIDYSLFMVSRFREELRRGRSVGDAVEIAVATSGKAVTFSGIAVAVGLGGLLAFSAPALRSFGIGGGLTVAASLFFALTFLPALLGVLGHRVNAGGRVDRTVSAAAAPPPREVARPPRPAGAHRERRDGAPIFVLVPRSPAVHRGRAVLRPQAGHPRRVHAAEGPRESRGGGRDPGAVRARHHHPDRRARGRAGQPGVRGERPRPRGLRDPAGRGGRHRPGREPVQRDRRPGDRPAAHHRRAGFPLRAARGHLAGAAGGPVGPVRERLGRPLRRDQPATRLLARRDGVIPRLRALDPGAGLTASVGGFAASGHDFLQSQSDRIPVAVGIVIIAMGAILFLLFGSVVLPAKAIFMTLLSISASFGALVWIFQEGNLSGPLGFTSPGFTIAGNPIIMFAVLFGLSMDYEVLLLSRVQEAWRRTGDNRASVAEGLAKTAGVITGAAVIMVSVFAAFALAETITIKSIGVGMAIAVLVDATIVRVLLVPATMRLLGRWNWWAPGFMATFADRVGFSHVEDEATVPTDEAPPGGVAGAPVADPSRGGAVEPA
jgi:RND superfamily putative drug exporter